jgi:hypothetical protein
MGVLTKGSRRDAGLTIFHSDRVIKGWPETYRPEEIYGDERNDLLNQRLLGRYIWTIFSSAIPRTRFSGWAAKKRQIEARLKDHFTDYMRFANEVRTSREDPHGPSYQEKETAVPELETELSSTNVDAVHRHPCLPQEMVSEAVKAVVDRVSENAVPRFDVKIGEITVYLYLQSDLIVIVDILPWKLRDTEIIIIVSENHPHWFQLRDTEGV